MKSGIFAIGVAMVLGLAGASWAAEVKDCRDCGTVRSVDVMNKSGEASGKGAVIGAVIGGVVGHQFGSGKGQDAATAAGAVGGAAAGHQTEKNRSTGSYYRITVDMESGGTKEVNVDDPKGLKPGAKVRVAGNNLERVEG